MPPPRHPLIQVDLILEQGRPGTSLLVLDIPGGGVDLNIKIPGCVCWGSENVPILKDALGKKNIPILKGSLHTSYPYYGVISS